MDSDQPRFEKEYKKEIAAFRNHMDAADWISIGRWTFLVLGLIGSFITPTAALASQGVSWFVAQELSTRTWGEDKRQDLRVAEFYENIFSPSAKGQFLATSTYPTKPYQDIRLVNYVFRRINIDHETKKLSNNAEYDQFYVRNHSDQRERMKNWLERREDDIFSTYRTHHLNRNVFFLGSIMTFLPIALILKQSNIWTVLREKRTECSRIERFKATFENLKKSVRGKEKIIANLFFVSFQFFLESRNSYTAIQQYEKLASKCLSLANLLPPSNLTTKELGDLNMFLVSLFHVNRGTFGTPNWMFAAAKCWYGDSAEATTRQAFKKYPIQETLFSA